MPKGIYKRKREEKMKKDYKDLAQAIRSMKVEFRGIPDELIAKDKIKRKLQIVVDKISYVISNLDLNFDMDDFDKLINHPSFETEQRRRKRWIKQSEDLLYLLLPYAWFLTVLRSKWIFGISLYISLLSWFWFGLR